MSLPEAVGGPEARGAYTSVEYLARRGVGNERRVPSSVTGAAGRGAGLASASG